MARQLNIRSDEAYEIASNLADHLGTSTTAVVVDALRAYEARLAPPAKLHRTARRRYEALIALAKRTAKHKRAGASSDHSDFYREDGLPR